MAHRERPGPSKSEQVQKALVEVKTLSDAAARRLLSNSVTKARGQITGITITLPLAERSRYLVLNVPQDTVKAVVERIGSLPEEQQRSYLKNWVRQNQRVMLSEYLYSGKNSFRIGISAQGPSVLAGVRPTRVPSLPRQIRKGKGTENNPYHVYLSKNKGRSKYGKIGVTAPFSFRYPALEVEGKPLLVKFEVHFDVRQLTRNNMKTTWGELKSVLSAAIVRNAAQKGIKPDDITLVDVLGESLNSTYSKFTKVIETAARQDPYVRSYIDTH